ncbi:Tyrosine recombinase XerC [subsurface metagenome]
MQNNLNTKIAKGSVSLRNIIEEDLIKIIKGLSSEELLGAYRSLSGPKTKSNNNLQISEKNSPLEKDTTREYTTHLRSQNKACSTVKDYVNISVKFTSYIKQNRISLESLTMSDIDQYLSLFRSRNISNNTYAKLINCIRSFLRFLNGREYIKADFASLIKIPLKVESIKEELSDLDIKNIKNYLPARKEKYKNENLRDIIIFNLGIDCGLRRQEFINLNWEDINLKENSINIKNSKGRKNRVVYFNKDLRELLYLYRKLNGKYINALIRGAHGKRITKCSLQNIISRIFKESKTYRKNLTLHSLRHTYAERLRRKGIDLPTISKLLGHSRLDTTDIYLHVNKDDFKMAVL